MAHTCAGALNFDKRYSKKRIRFAKRPMPNDSLPRQHVATLTSNDVPHVISVLADAFYDYPVMRYILGAGSDDYASRLHKLVRLFVMARVLRAEPMIGIFDGSELCGAATMSYPDESEPPAAFNELRAEAWDQLGAEARLRYDRCVAAWQPMSISVPQLHLNMIGVRSSFQGTGFARRLLDHAHGLSRISTASTGVSLTTERFANVALYRHFGYEVVGHAQVAPELETWGLFRPDHATSSIERSP